MLRAPATEGPEGNHTSSSGERHGQSSGGEEPCVATRMLMRVSKLYRRARTALAVRLRGRPEGTACACSFTRPAPVRAAAFDLRALSLRAAAARSCTRCRWLSARCERGRGGGACRSSCCRANEGCSASAWLGRCVVGGNGAASKRAVAAELFASCEVSLRTCAVSEWDALILAAATAAAEPVESAARMTFAGAVQALKALAEVLLVAIAVVIEAEAIPLAVAALVDLLAGAVVISSSSSSMTSTSSMLLSTAAKATAATLALSMVAGAASSSSSTNNLASCRDGLAAAVLPQGRAAHVVSISDTVSRAMLLTMRDGWCCSSRVPMGPSRRCEK
eukprot:6201654-Pleurochrysis_carterae.AAC.1